MLSDVANGTELRMLLLCGKKNQEIQMSKILSGIL